MYLRETQAAEMRGMFGEYAVGMHVFTQDISKALHIRVGQIHQLVISVWPSSSVYCVHEAQPLAQSIFYVLE